MIRKLVFIVSLLLFASDGSAQFGTSTYVFPQVADGRFADGSYYVSTLMVANPASFQKPSCVLQFQGLAPQELRMRDNTLRSDLPLRFQLNGNGWQVIQTPGTQNFSRGYALLECSSPADAMMLFTFYSGEGVKLSEATVFSAPRATDGVFILVDQRQGERLGIAVANTENVARNYRLVVRDIRDTVAGERTISLAPRSSIAQFLDELVTLPAGFIGRAMLVPTESPQPVHAVGLRFTGAEFTTLPALECRRFLVASDCVNAEVP